MCALKVKKLTKTSAEASVRSTARSNLGGKEFDYESNDRKHHCEKHAILNAKVHPKTANFCIDAVEIRTDFCPKVLQGLRLMLRRSLKPNHAAPFCLRVGSPFMQRLRKAWQ